MIARILIGGLLLVVFATLLAVQRAERFINRVTPVEMPEVSEAARRLHAESLVLDMHTDSLLFGRDLLTRSNVGHVDVPRLQEGGVGLQFFTIVTQTPIGMNIDATDGDALDMLTLVGLLRFDTSAFQTPFERALAQAARLDELIARSEGQLRPVRSVPDLEALLVARSRDPQVVGALLGIEGAQALDGDPDNVRPLFETGVRMIGLTHFFDNPMAGSAHGLEKAGLSESGRRVVTAMNELGIVVDLAHLSAAAMEDVLAMTRHPALVSHGGVRGTCDNQRNLSDDQIRAIAAGGGVIGIGYWDTAVCGREPRHVVAAMQHVISLVGDEYVGLGSDYDGATNVGFDTSQLPGLTQAMLDAGISPGSIRKILGGNAVRVLRQVLPGV